MRRLRFAFLCVCIIGVLVYSVRTVADFCARAGDFLVEHGTPVRGMKYLSMSVRLAPEVMRYRILYVNTVTDLCVKHPNRKAREMMVAEMVRMAALTVRRMPNDSDAHYVLAFASRSAWRITGEERYRLLAVSEARKSIEMAPEFAPTKDLLHSVE